MKKIKLEVDDIVVGVISLAIFIGVLVYIGWLCLTVSEDKINALPVCAKAKMEIMEGRLTNYDLATSITSCRKEAKEAKKKAG